jgi:hypothetical protein
MLKIVCGGGEMKRDCVDLLVGVAAVIFAVSVLLVLVHFSKKAKNTALHFKRWLKKLVEQSQCLSVKHAALLVAWAQVRKEW